jgi:hypothetical protein
MRSSLAVFTAFIVFLLSWFINASLIYILAFAAVSAGAGAGIFLILNVLFVWIICPGIGAFVGVSAAIKRFLDVEIGTIFAGFISVCSVLIILFFVFSTSMYIMELNSFWNVILLVLQGISVIYGAKFGKSYAISKI